MCRIVARQMCVGFNRSQVIDRNDLDIVLFVALVMSAENVAADTAIAIDGNANSHFMFLRAVDEGDETLDFTAMQHPGSIVSIRGLK